MKFAFTRKMKNIIHPPTMGTWSRVIKTFDSLPEVYEPFVRRLQAKTGAFPYVVFTPGAEITIRSTPEQVLCLENTCLYFLENNENRLTVTTFPFDEVCSLEVGAILLFSWLTVHGATQEGQIHSKRVEFNSVSYPHFLPIIDALRKAPSSPDDRLMAGERKKFDILNSLSFKFMNYGRKSLMGDEHVIAFIWESEIREKIFSRLGLPFSRTVSCAHLTLLTDRELILISEDEISPLVKGSRYGGIWRYIPLSNLRSLSLDETERGMLNLNITLNDGTGLPVLFRPGNRTRVEDLVDRAVECIHQDISQPV